MSSSFEMNKLSLSCNWWWRESKSNCLSQIQNVVYHKK